MSNNASLSVRGRPGIENAWGPGTAGPLQQMEIRLMPTKWGLDHLCQHHQKQDLKY